MTHRLNRTLPRLLAYVALIVFFVWVLVAYCLGRFPVV